jgi:hypothetical protein
MTANSDRTKIGNERLWTDADPSPTHAATTTWLHPRLFGSADVSNDDQTEIIRLEDEAVGTLLGVTTLVTGLPPRRSRFKQEALLGNTDKHRSAFGNTGYSINTTYSTLISIVWHLLVIRLHSSTTPTPMEDNGDLILVQDPHEAAL